MLNIKKETLCQKWVKLSQPSAVPSVHHKIARNEAEYAILFYPEATKNSSSNNCCWPRVKAV